MINFSLVDKFFISEGEVQEIRNQDGLVMWSAAGSDMPQEWKNFFDSISRKTYKQDYAIGDEIGTIELGDEGTITMVVAAFDSDELSTGNYYAAVTLIAKEVLITERPIDDEPVDSYIGSDIYDYINDNLITELPQFIIDNLKNVKKYTQEASSQTQTNESLWIPSARELGAANYEQTGAIYSSLFNSDSSRIKRRAGDSTLTRIYWTRSKGHADYFRYITRAGKNSYLNPLTEGGVVLGMCFGIGAQKMPASLALRAITGGHNEEGTGTPISDEEALNIIMGGRYY